MRIELSKTSGLILAGGQSRRMGGREKSLIEIEGKPLIAHVYDRIARQVPHVLVNANGDPSRFAFLGVPVAADRITGFAGPLAGIHAGMAWLAQNRPRSTHLVSVAADTPFFPTELAQKLAASAGGERSIVLAASGGNRHPVFGLWPVALGDELASFLSSQNSRKVMDFVGLHDNVIVEFPAGKPEDTRPDPFFNINTPDDYDRACTVWRQVYDTAST